MNDFASQYHDLPEDLHDVVDRMFEGREHVYGFELELVADYVSR